MLTPLLATRSAPPTRRPLNVVAYVDATDPQLERDFAAKARNVQSMSADYATMLTRRGTAPPTAAELGQWLAVHMRPMERNVFYVSGHGMGTTVANIPMQDVAKALDVARSASGLRPDVLFMEACAMGHLDGLAQVAGKADVAIVSEETIPVDALPTLDMLRLADHSDATNQELARQMIKRVPTSSGMRAISAVDLNQVGDLWDATQTLRQTMAEHASTEAGMKTARIAIKDGMWYLPISSKQFGFADYGQFLRSLSKRTVSEPLREQAAEAKDGLEKTVLVATTNREYGGASGLSFRAQIGDTRLNWWDLLAD